jgi:hypothetical protein
MSDLLLTVENVGEELKIILSSNMLSFAVRMLFPNPFAKFTVVLLWYVVMKVFFSSVVLIEIVYGRTI